MDYNGENNFVWSLFIYMSQNLYYVFVFCSILVAGALISCSLIQSGCDLNVALMNVQRCLIRELLLFEFKLGHNANFCVKSERAINHITGTRWFKKFRSGCKKPNDQASTGRAISVDSEAMIKVKETNPRSRSM